MTPMVAVQSVTQELRDTTMMNSAFAPNTVACTIALTQMIHGISLEEIAAGTSFTSITVLVGSLLLFIHR